MFLIRKSIVVNSMPQATTTNPSPGTSGVIQQNKSYRRASSSTFSGNSTSLAPDVNNLKGRKTSIRDVQIK